MRSQAKGVHNKWKFALIGVVLSLFMAVLCVVNSGQSTLAKDAEQTEQLHYYGTEISKGDVPMISEEEKNAPLFIADGYVYESE